MNKIKFISPKGRKNISKQLINNFSTGITGKIVVGFISNQGTEFLHEIYKKNPNIEIQLIVGAATRMALNALTELRKKYSKSKLEIRLHLGHGLESESKRFKPMLHSKLYLSNFTENYVCLVGSHNMTGFAIQGKNQEASIQVKGSLGDEFHQDACEHFRIAWDEATEFDISEIDAYAKLYKMRLNKFFSELDNESSESSRKNKALVWDLNGQIDQVSRGEIIGINYEKLPFELTTSSYIQVHIVIHSKEFSGTIICSVADHATREESSSGVNELNCDWTFDPHIPHSNLTRVSNLSRSSGKSKLATLIIDRILNEKEYEYFDNNDETKFEIDKSNVIHYTPPSGEYKNEKRASAYLIRGVSNRNEINTYLEMENKLTCFRSIKKVNGKETYHLNYYP